MTSLLDQGQTEEGLWWNLLRVGPQVRNPFGFVKLIVSPDRRGRTPERVQKSRTAADPSAELLLRGRIAEAELECLAKIAANEYAPPAPPADPLEVLFRRALTASTFAAERARRFEERTAKPKHGKKKKKQPRSKAVTGWVLAQAVDSEGQPRCERCLRTHWLGDPIFRQGHHVLDFATYPERDDLWNVIALCGNCHDNSHQGLNAEEFNQTNAEILRAGR